MAYWLFKSEPGSWSWDDQVRKGEPGSTWAVGTEVHLVHRLAEEVAPAKTVVSLDQFDEAFSG